MTGDTRSYGDTNTDVGDTVTRRNYTDFLPSMNLSPTPRRTCVRASLRKTMNPLDLENYGGGLTIATADLQGPTPANPGAAPLGVRQVTGASSSGNPFLNPWRSTNYDLAVEYYLGGGTMVNISLFKLEIDSFVPTTTTPTAVSPTRTAPSAVP